MVQYGVVGAISNRPCANSAAPTMAVQKIYFRMGEFTNMRQPTCQACGRLRHANNTFCECGAGYVQHPGYVQPPGYPGPQQPPYAPYPPPVYAKPKKPPGQTMIKVVSIINIVLAGIGTLATAEYVGVFYEETFEFVILALILGMSIAGLVMAKDKSKANLILAFGIVILVLLAASIAVIPDEPLFVLFGTQGILYIVGAVRRRSAEV